jgi:membrane protein implicated in regulation of membrane protease activity
MMDRRFLSRLVLGAIAFLVFLMAGGLVVMTESPVLKAVGAVVAVAYVVFLFVSDLIEARLNEKHVEEHPHLLKNEAVGETVTVSGDFEVQSGSAKGMVVLHGAQWKAYCAGDHVPKDGDTLLVRAREGLTLVVQARGYDLPRP